ncbi:MAG: ATP-grasp domain-containing protein [Rhodopirellula sp. JB055]|uniref:ATP-grasp domain-containing protein n=1 Tax=Rhodopirellula sp. JB055 TaxID=3342846 RepID=UPI00370BF81F
MKTVTNPCHGENRPAILLAGASVRWAAQSLRRGLPNSRIIGLDWFGDSDTRMVCDEFHSLQSEEGSSRNLAEQIDSVADFYSARVLRVGGLRVAGGIESQDAWLRLQTIVRDLADESGSDDFPVTIPLTYQCSAEGCRVSGAGGEESPITTAPAGASGQPLRWLWKQHDSTGGLGIRWAMPAGEPTAELGVGWLQQRVHGRSYGLVAIAEADRTRVLGLCRGLHHRFGDRPFVYSGSRGPVFELGDSSRVLWSTLQKVSERVAQEFSLRGLFNLDFVCDDTGRWWLLELNARPSASCEVIERWATEVGCLPADHSLMRMHLGAMDGNGRVDQMSCLSSQERRPDETLSRQKGSTHWVKRIVFANRNAMVDVEKIQHKLRAESIAAELADLPLNTPTFVAAGEPILTLLVRMDDPLDRRDGRAKKMAATHLRRAIRIVQGAA